MSKRFFTSDLHVSHKLVAGTRGFGTPDAPDTDAHDAAIAANWDRVVGRDDVVYVLGDIAMNPRKGAFEWLAARPGRKVLIAGNHDEVAGFHSKALTERLKPAWTSAFAGGITDFAFLKFGPHRAALSHYPYEGEGSRDIEDRMTEVRLRDTGVPLLHGHTHENAKYRLSDAGSHQLHVGLDAWNLELVPESEVLEWLSYLP